MLLQESKFKKLEAVFKEKHSFLLATPAPDGDSIGSLLAVFHLLNSLGKKVYLYVKDAMSPSLCFLPGVEHIANIFPEERVDCLVIVDTGHSSRLFEDEETKWRNIAGVIVNIDHHKGCDDFGHLNIVDYSAAAVGEILLELFRISGYTITKEIGVCLLTSIIADTGGLKYTNVTPRTLRAAAEILEQGVDIYSITRALYSSKKVTTMKLAGCFLASLKEEQDGCLVWGRLTRQMFEASGAKEEEGDKLVEELDALSRAKIYCLFKENLDGSIKVSLRSRSQIPVRDIAVKFGGGGHIQASGCHLDGPIESAETKILSELRLLMEKV